MSLSGPMWIGCRSTSSFLGASCTEPKTGKKSLRTCSIGPTVRETLLARLSVCSASPARTMWKWSQSLRLMNIPSNFQKRWKKRQIRFPSKSVETKSSGGVTSAKLSPSPLTLPTPRISTMPFRCEKWTTAVGRWVCILLMCRIMSASALPSTKRPWTVALRSILLTAPSPCFPKSSATTCVPCVLTKRS